ncbi:MAG TPA: acyl carrier protein [Candidatus Acidoferrum sp.]|nr:acyl carrier protein [Candidatus Acidoferrum sp.]
MPDSIEEKVISTLASVKHIPPEKITIDSSLAELGFDSLDTISLLFELENTFQISVPDDRARSIRTVREIVEGVRALKESAPSQPAQAG